MIRIFSFMAVCLMFSLNSFGQVAYLENSSNCDLHVQLYTMDANCNPAGIYNYVVLGNGGAVTATPPAGEEFVYAEITNANSCTPGGFGLALEADQNCVNCSWGSGLPNADIIYTNGCAGCQSKIVARWTTCDNHFVFY